MTAAVDVLYVTPVAPASAGNGLAMRAGAVLRALARTARVHLLVVPLYPSPVPMPSSELNTLCTAVAVVPPSAGHRDGTDWVRRAANAFRGAHFDLVHHFRLATLPFGAPYLRPSWWRRPRAHLDLDDVESLARRRLASVYRLNGREVEARVEEREAERAGTLEAQVLRRFDRVYVCASTDRDRLHAGAKAELYVLPNAVELPASIPASPHPRAADALDSAGSPMTSARPLRLLFVGTLGYFPNEDAVLSFCRETLPLLRLRAPRTVHLDVVGTGPSAGLLAGTEAPDIHVAGPVSDLTPWYQATDAVIVPLRAGGGTRIKVLEAFAHRRPVVSTSLGAEGIDAEDGEHLLLADTPAEFADACLRLLREPALAARLAANAFELVRRRYTVDAMTRALSISAPAAGRQGAGRCHASR